MRRMIKEEFLNAMRDAEIEKRISRSEDIPDIDKEENMDTMTDSDAAYLDMLRREEIKHEEIPEAPKKRGRKLKAAKQPEEKKLEEKKPEQAAAQKKPGRKPEAVKLKKAAGQIAAKTMDDATSKADKQEESLRFLIGIARGRTREIIRNAEAHIKSADKLADLAEIYDSHIRTVEEMLK